jgi:AcrR family transcriptional regulator
VSKKVKAADGRVIGDRAKATRNRLLEATATLLERDGVLELKVVDVTREVGAAPATFYQYFADIDAAILALAEEATDDEAPLIQHLTPAWSTPDDFARAQAFVDAYTRYWDEHSSVLRIRNLKAEEGDPSFRKTRTAAHLLLMTELSRMVETGQQSGRVDQTLDPVATAAAMLAMLERLLAYRSELQRRGPTADSIRDTLTTVLFQTLSGLRR